MNKSNINMMSGVIAAVLFVLSMVVLGTAEATGTPGDCGTPGAAACGGGSTQNHWNNPNDGSSVGNCTKDGKFCWNIQIGNDQNHWGFPIEYYGNRARRLIADGQIEWANMNHFGVLYLGVWSRFDNRPFDCTVNIQRRKYHCESH